MSGRSILLLSCGIVLSIVGAVYAVKREALDTVLAVIGVVLALPPVLREYWLTGRHVAAISDASGGLKAQSGTLIRLHSLRHGLYGGLVGGLLAGLVVGIVYYAELSDQLVERDAFSVVSPVIIYSTLSGALLGALVDAAVGIMTDIARQHPGNALVANEISGGLIGGLLTGLIMGPVGGWYFGRKIGPVADPVAVLIASGPGLLAVVLAILGYIRPAFSWSLIYRAVISTVFGCAVLFFAGTLATAFGVSQAIEHFFDFSDDRSLVIGGLYFGAFCGTVWGIAIGLALLLSRAE